jgi:hypothetical protein
LEDAQFAATSALSKCLHEIGMPQSPMDMAAVEWCEEWLTQNHLDLPKAVVSMISVAA